MFITVNEEIKSILDQKIRLKKKISNKDLFLIQCFQDITHIYPKNVILNENFILFFVENSKYFRSKHKLRILRQKMPSKKILIIRHETSLLKLLFGLFPDIFIDDILIKVKEQKRILLIVVKLLTYRERMIAIGAKGKYIKIVNKIMNKFFRFEYEYNHVTIRCEVKDLIKKK